MERRGFIKELFRTGCKAVGQMLPLETKDSSREAPVDMDAFMIPELASDFSEMTRSQLGLDPTATPEELQKALLNAMAGDGPPVAEK